MKIKLTLAEMFSASRLTEFQNIIGYRAALTKFFHQCLDNEKFSKIVSLFEEIKLNAQKVSQEKNKEKQQIFFEVQSFKKENKEIPEELKNKVSQFNSDLISSINEINKDIITEVNEYLSDSSEEYEFEFNELLIKAIKNIVESEKSVQELKLEPAVITAILSLYAKMT